MKNLLMIARFFPPEGSATSFRVLRFLRQLTKVGWNVTVVTAVPSQYERYDPKLATMVPSQTQVIRAKGYDLWQQFQSWRFRRISKRHEKAQSLMKEPQPYNKSGGIRSWVRKWVHRAEDCWYFPDIASPWIRPAIKASLEVCAQDRPKIIWANAGRISTFLIAQKISARTGVPYMLDFDDAWTVTSNEYDARKPRWMKRKVRRAMFDLLKGAQSVVFRYESEAECFWRAYPGALQASKIYIIPNGFESPIEPFVTHPGERCTILYGGILPDYRYDTLLEALQVFKSADSVSARQLRLRFVGEGMSVLAGEVAARELQDIVETSGPISYEEIIRLQREAHALLVLGRSTDIRGYELFAGAKLFGYLKCGRPIIGVLPKDETKQVLLRVGAKTIADVDSVPEIIHVLKTLLEKWAVGDLESLVPDRKACEVYSSEQQTEILVRALEGLPSKRPFIPGAQSIPPSLREIENSNWIDGAC